jgi:hypothetical protein
MSRNRVESPERERRTPVRVTAPLRDRADVLPEVNAESTAKNPVTYASPPAAPSGAYGLATTKR